MSQFNGRHRPDEDRGRTATTAVLLLGFLTTGTALYIRSQSTDSGAKAASATRSATSGGPTDSSSATPSVSATTALAACADATPLVVDAAFKSAFDKVAAAYATSHQNTCTPVTVTSADDTMAAAVTAAKDHTALFVSRTIGPVGLLPKGLVQGNVPTVATSPIQMAMPAGMASALQVPEHPLSTEMFRRLLLGQTTWKDLNHPQWGSFGLRMVDPKASATGTAAFAGLTGLANGGPLTKAPNYANPSPADLAVIKVEHHITSIATSDAAVLPGVKEDLTAVTKRASGYITTEAELAAYNAQNPTVPLVGTPVAGGMSTLDLRLATLGDPTKDAAGAQTASSFAQFVLSPAGQAVLQAAGLRTVDGKAPTAPAPTGVTYAAAALSPAPLSAEQSAGMSYMWSAMHSRNSSLVLIDGSGSMKQNFGNTGVSKIDLVRGMVQRVFAISSPKARSGVWFFNATDAGAPIITRSTTLDVNDTTSGTMLHSQQVAAAINNAKIQGGTPLYQAVREAYGYTMSRWSPDYQNQLVVLSDGANQDSTSKDTLASLLAYLKSAQDPKRPLKIICVGYGQKADMASLQAIASATGGKVAQVRSPGDVGAALNAALFS